MSKTICILDGIVKKDNQLILKKIFKPDNNNQNNYKFHHNIITAVT